MMSLAGYQDALGMKCRPKVRLKLAVRSVKAPSRLTEKGRATTEGQPGSGEDIRAPGQSPFSYLWVNQRLMDTLGLILE